MMGVEKKINSSFSGEHFAWDYLSSEFVFKQKTNFQWFDPELCQNCSAPWAPHQTQRPDEYYLSMGRESWGKRSVLRSSFCCISVAEVMDLWLFHLLLKPVSCPPSCPACPLWDSGTVILAMQSRHLEILRSGRKRMVIHNGHV